MKALKITEAKRQDITEAGIVICTAKTATGEVDVIDISHKADYSTLKQVEVIEDTDAE